MIDASQIIQDAMRDAPLSLKDDPTAWSTSPTRADVTAALATAARENAVSALAKALGDASERIAMLMDAAIAEDGPLADLDAVWTSEITGGPTPFAALSVLADVKKWDDKLEAVRLAMVDFVERVVPSSMTVEPAVVTAMIDIDPRLAHLVADPDFTPPAFLNAEPPAEDIVWDDEPEITEPASGDAITKRSGAKLVAEVPNGTKLVEYDGDVIAVPPDGPPLLIDWDEEPTTVSITETVAELEKAGGRRGYGRRSHKPSARLSVLLEAGGFLDKDACKLMGVDKSYYSQIRRGGRPWPGLRDHQVAALRKELDGRVAALQGALSALADNDVLHPENG